MATQTLKELTLHLPAELVAQIQEKAVERQQTMEEVVADLLSRSLPSLRQQAAPPLRPQLSAMAADPEIQRELQAIQAEFAMTESDGLA